MVHVGDIGVILGGRSSTLKVELPKYLHVSNGIRVQVVHVGTTAPFITSGGDDSNEFYRNGRPTDGTSTRMQVVDIMSISTGR